MAKSGTDDCLLCVALAVVDPCPRRGKEPIRITEKIGNPSIRQAIPDKWGHCIKVTLLSGS